MKYAPTKWKWILVAVATAASALPIVGHFQRASSQVAAPAPDLHFAAGPASAPSAIAWDRKGIKIKYPADWQPKKSADYELMLLPTGGQGETWRVTLDIPDLPPHLPFMIQMTRVQHDYLQDLKKEHPDLKVNEEKDVSVPEGKARLVCSTWHEGKLQHDDTVLLIIHASAVFILDAQCGEDHLPATRGCFDSIESSIQWTKH